MMISAADSKTRLRHLKNISDTNEMDFESFWSWFTDKFDDAVAGCDDYENLVLQKELQTKTMQVLQLQLLLFLGSS